jgi:ABC-type dipeptide/oligopeptide/nickel transport system permease component
MTAVVLLSFLFVGANLIADLMYGFLDPRIRLE